MYLKLINLVSKLNGMKISSLKYTILFLSVFGIVFPCFAQVKQAEIGIRQVMNDLDVVGLSVAVVKNGDIIYAQSFGLKDKSQQIPLTNQSLFRIASISKSFSATAIMQLVEKGKFSLDDDFSKLVGFKVRNPKFPETVITLKMVLSHTSSINDREGYFNLDVINPDKNTNWQKCYNDYEPGKGYQYCNLNFNMIGTVIEKFSNERFDNYIKHHILKPMDLYGGYCVDSLNQQLFATLYEYDAKTKSYTASPAAYHPRREEIKNYQMGYSTPIFSPTGGMKISATDLAKYMTMHMYKGHYKKVRIIAKKSAVLMQTKVSDEENYGLALQTVNDLIEGKNMVGHTGSAYGLYSAMFFEPKEKFGFVVITNGSMPNYKNGMNEVLSRTINVLYNSLIK